METGHGMTTKTHGEVAFNNGLLEVDVPEASGVRLATSDPLYIIGARDTHMYLLLSGRLKAVTISASGKQCLVDIYSPGDIVGLCCLHRAQRDESVIAMAPATLRKMPREALGTILMKEGLRETFLAYMADRLSMQQNFISRLVTETSENRLAYALLTLGQRIGTIRPDGKLWIKQRFTQDELASMVGTTRSRVGLFLKKFRKEQLIEGGTHSSIIINASRLDEFIHRND